MFVIIHFRNICKTLLNVLQIQLSNCKVYTIYNVCIIFLTNVCKTYLIIHLLNLSKPIIVMKLSVSMYFVNQYYSLHMDICISLFFRYSLICFSPIFFLNYRRLQLPSFPPQLTTNKSIKKNTVHEIHISKPSNQYEHNSKTFFINCKQNKYIKNITSFSSPLLCLYMLEMDVTIHISI